MIFTSLELQNHNVDQIAELIYETEPALFSLFFGKNRRRAFDRIGNVVKAGGNSFGFEHIYLAIENNDILGLVIAYQGGDIDKSVEQDRLSEALDFFGLWRLGIYDSIINSRYLSTGFSSDELYISNVSVGFEFRGHGVGSFLVKNVIDLAKKKGCKRIILDVATENKVAIGLYEKMGFTIASVKKSWFWGFSINKMVLEIGS